MFKRVLTALLIAVMLFAVVGCGRSKVLHCDHCNAEVEVKEDSNMNEDWAIYCESCNEKLFGNDPVLGTGDATTNG